MTPVILLCSGGLDSTTVSYWLEARAIPYVPIFFDYGQHCVEKEWKTLRQVLPAVAIGSVERIDISGVFRGSRSRLIAEADLWTQHVADEDLYVPYRTLLLFAAAAACAQTRGSSAVYSGFINSNHAKEVDCSSKFLNDVGELASGIGSVSFIAPFRNWSKAEVAHEAMRLGVPIGLTYSCQLLSDTPCGACPNCVDRLNALKIVEEDMRDV